MKIYVATSWRNGYQPDVIRGLRELGHEVYDFRNPTAGDCGFAWSEIDIDWESWSIEQFQAALKHPLAEDGYKQDFEVMLWADICVRVLPCGRSAHLEAGYFVGGGKPLLILLDRIEPALMYKMADSVHSGLGSISLRIQEIQDAVSHG